nr:DEAD/DEAH box helicase [uncultured Flavonifractor sp.]
MQIDLKKNLESPKISACLSREYDTCLPDNVCCYPVSPDITNIADGIDHVLDSFNATFIHAPTGFGKTHFILYEILPKVIQDGGKILLASNRVAVSYQQKLELMKMIDESEIGCLTPEGVIKKTDFGPVKIMTLQALDFFLATPDGKKYAKEVSVLVLDEVHYFTSDVSFNPNSARLLKAIPRLFKDAIRIYMTATPEDILRPLAEAEMNAVRPMVERIGTRLSPLVFGQPPVINLYQFKSDKYKYLPVRYFKGDEELYQRIRDNKNDKWLIFVSSKENGKSMQKELGKDAVFISADSKGSDTWNQLLSEEHFSSQVMITTSVLDCGVNIHDDSLKHVVIPFEDRVSFMQALGRVRFKGRPNFTLYVKALSKQRLNGLVQKNCELLSLAKEIQTHTYNNSFVDRFRQENDIAKGALLYLDYKGSYTFNDLYYHKLRQQKTYYNQLARFIDQDGEYDESTFPHIVHQWLGQSDAYDEQNWLGHNMIQKSKQDLLTFLESYKGRCLNSESEQKSFGETLYQFYKNITGSKKRDDRGDGYLKTAALNNCLKEMQIGGEINSSGKGGGWRFNMEADGGETDTFL